jgi:hypothetical protein
LEPLDPNLNAAIISIAKRLFPDGFDISAEAPDTYEKLKAHLDAGKRLVVFSGGSARTIYADPAVNHAFRARHDWCHYTGGHDLTFPGEIGITLQTSAPASPPAARRSSAGPRSSTPRSSGSTCSTSHQKRIPSISAALHRN